MTLTELRSAIAVHHTATDDGAWDGPAAKKNLPSTETACRKAFAWVDPKENPDSKSSYSFIHHDVSSDGTVGAANMTGCSTGIGVLNGGRGGTVIPEADKKGVYSHLAAHLKDGKLTAPELKSASLALGREIRDAFMPWAVELRAQADGTPTELVGHFSKYLKWYRVDSLFEGAFMERVMPGAFDNTIAQHRSQMRVCFNHGFDPSIGDKPLGQIKTLDGSGDGAYYEVALADTDYNRNQVVPLLQGRLMDGTKVGSMLGASMAFSATDDTWEMKPKPTQDNPDLLPRRSVNEARVYEFGPVTFPASPAATAGVRSGTDEFIQHLLEDPRFALQLAKRSSLSYVNKAIEAARSRAGAADPATEESDERACGGSKPAEMLREVAGAHPIWSFKL